MHLLAYPPTFSIYINFLTPSTYKANVTAHTTGRLLLDSLQFCVMENNPMYKLTYNDKVIRNDETLEKLGIKEGDKIFAIESKYPLSMLTMPKRIVPASIKLYIKTPAGKVITLILSSSDFIEIIIQKIQEKEGIPLDQQQIFFNGRILKYGYTLAFYNIHTESILNLVIESHLEMFQIFINILRGEEISLDVHSNLSVYFVKLAIREKKDFPPNIQALIFAGRQLDNDCTLADCNIKSKSKLHLVLRISAGMFHETSGRKEFNALPPLTRYTQTSEENLQDGVHIGIACDSCGKSEWKGVRLVKILNDLYNIHSFCFSDDAILLTLCPTLFSVHRYKCMEFSKNYESIEYKDCSKCTAIAPVTISPILPTTKEEMLTLLREEERLRLSPEIQKQYYNVGNDPTLGIDWMDVTDQMQKKLVKDFGYSNEAVQLLRRAPQLYKDDPAFHTTQLYVRNNIARKGDLTEGMKAPDCPLVPLESLATTVEIRNSGTPITISLHSLYRSRRPLVLLGSSYTCPLFRYMSHVLNDIYERYQTHIDFYMIQIREAHASDVWPIGNIIDVKKHRTLADRLSAAQEMVRATQLKIPMLADTMDDTFLRLYAPWPFRFFVIVDGVLKLVGMVKDACYDTTDLVDCLEVLLKDKYEYGVV
ncbi:12065_t:CDS:2 [Funneliformis mosseae]|uniref:12065_t:CDS:1 n=1 Tax=Funneliformis mosseae TaxID=27381 RepID=A0A9N9EFV6_FUNMO|nr:12065_t:CDS:2 [Funneliformis mosseae]